MNATFTSNGNTYEIKRTNYIIKEFDKIKSENHKMSAEDEQGLAILQDKYTRISRLAERVLELESKFYETFAQEDEEIYEKAKAHYEKEYADLVKFEADQNGVAIKAHEQSLDNAKKLVIKALQVDNKGENIRTFEEATEIWEHYEEEVGLASSNEWLTWFINFISGRDNIDENPFVAQAKAKAEQKANMKKGILKAK